jgi:hypothetical protein
MKMKEAQNICLPQVQSIIDYAILKAEVTTAYQPVEESMEVIFMKRNPGVNIQNKHNTQIKIYKTHTCILGK